ncbi:GNAT family N-acetyltransferase [Tellurirhabdus bombi]|uniref:GNAT family N-acetyltransferase n=1 Tax=Tellurirhabdus bombi TaxID=2907205 RepID=UPI001F419DF2|nr:GNAT family N-acetyltransferase [Tellurirhabdus bombi]
MRYLTRTQIDDDAYDRCVAASPERMIYAFSWYLDIVSPGWEVLVEGDYEAVMPLPVRRRYGVKALIQPLFCHQLGVFTAEKPTDATRLYAFLQTLSRHIRYAPSYQLHTGNEKVLSAASPFTESLHVRPLTNHVLRLEEPYTLLAAQYSRDRRLNLRRGLQADWTYSDTDDIEPLIAHFQSYNTGGIGRVASNAYPMLRQLVRTLLERGHARLRVAHRQGAVEAGCLLVTDVNRVIHLFCAASPAGRKGNARTVILDGFIQEYAGKPMLFDFESPEVESLASFNQSFGAVNEAFVRVSYSQLPGAIQWMHKLKKRLHLAIRNA